MKRMQILLLGLVLIPLAACAGQETDPAEVNALLKQMYVDLAAAKAQAEALKGKLGVAEAKAEALAAQNRELEENSARLRAVLRELAQRGFPVYEVLGKSAGGAAAGGTENFATVAPEIEKRIEQLIAKLADAAMPREGHNEDWDWSEAAKSARDEMAGLGEPAVEPLLGLAAATPNPVVKMRAAATIQAIKQRTQSVVGGKVLDVGDKNELISIGLGEKQGIAVGQVFLVMRDQKYIGQVRVTRVWGDLCVAQSQDKMEPPKVGDSAIAQVDLRRKPPAGVSPPSPGPVQPAPTPPTPNAPAPGTGANIPEPPITPAPSPAAPAAVAPQ